MIRRFVGALGLAFVGLGAASTAACDPAPAPQTTASDGKSGSGTPGASAGASAGAPGDKGGGPVTFDGLSSCLKSCEDPDKIPTNRETCKLNCDTVYGATAPAAGSAGATDPVSDAVTCLGRCYSGEGSPDSCAADCRKSAASVASAPSPAVLETLSTCVRTCHADDSVRATNQATCELNCGQAARVAGPAAPSGS